MGDVLKKLEDLQISLEAVNSLLNCGFLTPSTIKGLEKYKAELEGEIKERVKPQDEKKEKRKGSSANAAD